MQMKRLAHLVFTKHSLVVLEKRLDRNTLLLDIGKLALDVHWSHDSWSKNDGNVQWSHLSLY
jgi:hypothetical protein